MAIDPTLAAGSLGLDPSRFTQAPMLDAPGGLDGLVPMNQASATGGPAASFGAGPEGAFDGALKAIEQAEAKQQAATGLEQAYAKGEDVPLHAVMAAAEEASLALETLAALRNRVLDAVNELTRMQA